LFDELDPKTIKTQAEQVRAKGRPFLMTNLSIDIPSSFPDMREFTPITPTNDPGLLLETEILRLLFERRSDFHQQRGRRQGADRLRAYPTGLADWI
jgi:hypothetical protein